MVAGQTVRLGIVTNPTENIHAAVEHFHVHNECKGLSEHTHRYYRDRLAVYIRHREIHGVNMSPQQTTLQDLERYIADEAQRTSRATANHSVIALRAFFGWLHREGYIPTNPAARLQKMKVSKRIIETFTQEQVEAILGTCGKDFVGVRDRAMLMLFYDSGLRVSEMCSLSLPHLDLKQQTMLIHGKGGKERIVPFGLETKKALMTYLARRGNEANTEHVFLTCYADPLTRFRVREIVKDRCRRAGITGVRPSPHSLRHTCAVSLLRSGLDSFVLQKLLGHSSLDMTRVYVELSSTDVQEHHKMYSPADRLQSPKQTSGRRRLR